MRNSTVRGEIAQASVDEVVVSLGTAVASLRSDDRLPVIPPAPSPKSFNISVRPSLGYHPLVAWWQVFSVMRLGFS
jgi:hypothetical protein